LFQSSDTPQVPSALGAGIGMGIMLVYFVVLLLWVAGLWKIFVKAGEPGWAAIVPIYNLFVLAKIAGKPMWWGVLMLIPFVGIIIFIIACIALAERFGKGAGFGVGLGLLSPIFFPILGFGDATYR
jgi:hypothetical protein